MRALSEARIVAGVGIPGDRYAERRGTYSPRHHIDRQITLIEQETLEALARDHGVALAPHEHRRNLTTRGVALNHLVDREFSIAEVRLRGMRLCEPCLHMEKLAAKGAAHGLIHRGGLRAEIVSGGEIRVGERIFASEETA